MSWGSPNEEKKEMTDGVEAVWKTIELYRRYTTRVLKKGKHWNDFKRERDLLLAKYERKL